MASLIFEIWKSSRSGNVAKVACYGIRRTFPQRGIVEGPEEVALFDALTEGVILVLLIFVYAGLPFAGFRLSPFSAVVIAFFLNNSAYYGEIFRAGIVSVGFGQTEAARSTGLSYAQTLLYVVLPQAVRNVLPDLLSNTIEVIKLTSLASVVSLAEILYSAEMARSVTYNASPLVLAAGVYLVFLWPLVRLVSRFGRVLGHD